MGYSSDPSRNNERREVLMISICFSSSFIAIPQCDSMVAMQQTRRDKWQRKKYTVEPQPRIRLQSLNSHSSSLPICLRICHCHSLPTPTQLYIRSDSDFDLKETDFFPYFSFFLSRGFRIYTGRLLANYEIHPLSTGTDQTVDAVPKKSSLFVWKKKFRRIGKFLYGISLV